MSQRPESPHISIDISEFKHSYGGFMKIMCRIDAVPHSLQLKYSKLSWNKEQFMPPFYIC